MPPFHRRRPFYAAMQPLPAPAPAPPPPPKPKGGARILSAVLQAIVMAVVLALFFVFAGLAAFVLLHLCVLGRALRRRRRIGVSSPVAVAAPVFPGLSLSELKALPKFKYSVLAPAPAADCAVCLDELKEGQGCRSLPDCGHVFHVQCVDRWLVRTPACPICRALVGAPPPSEAVVSREVW